MIEITLPHAPEPWATVPVADAAPTLEQLATLQLENAAMLVENAALQARIPWPEARQGHCSSHSAEVGTQHRFDGGPPWPR